MSSEKQRYGHTTDVSSLLGSAEESNDYLVGLVIAAVIVIIIFSVFMLAIAVLWCCGRNNVGFLSGAPFQVPRHLSNNRREGGNSVTSENGFNSPTKQQHDSAQEHGNESDQNDGSTKRLLVRGTFVLSGIIFILFSILLCTQGITNLQDAVESVNESSTDVKNLSTDANTIITDGFVSVQSLATTLRDSIQSELQAESFCPLHPEFGAVGDIEVVRAQADEAVQKLDGLGSFLSGEIEGLTAAIGDVEKGALQVEQQTEKIDLTDWEILLILIPFTIVPCVLVTGAILAHFDVHFPLLNCFINWFFLPLFIVMVIVCIGTSSAMIAVASGNSDFCLPGGRTSDTYDGDSPDSTVYRMMDRSGYTINSGDLVRAVTDYYVEQCINVTNPYGFITDYIPDLVRRCLLLLFLLNV